MKYKLGGIEADVFLHPDGKYYGQSTNSPSDITFIADSRDDIMTEFNKSFLASCYERTRALRQASEDMSNGTLVGREDVEARLKEIRG